MEGFITKDGYGAIEYCNKLMILFNGEQLKVVKSIEEAHSFIEKHRAKLKPAVKKKTQRK